jgi:predicted lipid-binding transport protein (Tim44 family)
MSQLIEIVFFALLAGYLFFRLWSVLGKETDEDIDRRQKSFSNESEEETGKIIPLPGRAPILEEPTLPDDLTPGVREGVRQLQALEPDFQVESFLKGAKRAYKMIIEAYASGDRETLKELLTLNAYQQFEKAIETRESENQTSEVRIEAFEKIEVDHIDVKDKEALVTVRYRTRQVILTRDHTGVILDNPAEISVPMTDIWIFQRKMGEENPNWLLVSTQTQSYRDS